VLVSLSSDMPGVYGDLNAEYQNAVTAANLTVDELDDLALNAVRASFLSDAEKTVMGEALRAEYARLRVEHGLAQPA
jgi:adenosine deaminase